MKARRKENTAMDTAASLPRVANADSDVLDSSCFTIEAGVNVSNLTRRIPISSVGLKSGGDRHDAEIERLTVALVWIATILFITLLILCVCMIKMRQHRENKELPDSQWDINTISALQQQSTDPSTSWNDREQPRSEYSSDDRFSIYLLSIKESSSVASPQMPQEKSISPHTPSHSSILDSPRSDSTWM